MMVADRLTVHMHDDTTRTLPAGTRYALTGAGIQYVTPDGAEGAYSGWDVLRVDARNRKENDPMPDPDLSIKERDLPEGSVVAARFDPSEYAGGERFHPAGVRHIVYLRQDFDTVFGTFRWMCGVQGVSSSEVQKALDGGAVVLRHGTDGPHSDEVVTAPTEMDDEPAQSDRLLFFCSACNAREDEGCEHLAKAAESKAAADLEGGVTRG